MKNVIKNKHLNQTRLGVIATVITLTVIMGFLLWNTFLRENSTRVNLRGYALDGPTYTAKGQVTKKRTSCSVEILGTDGMITRGGGICDAGNSLEVAELQVSTGGGALESPPRKYVTDIKSIHAGDEVEVRYAKDAYGNASTNCKSCYVKKL